MEPMYKRVFVMCVCMCVCACVCVEGEGRTYPGFSTVQSFNRMCEAGKIPLLCFSRSENPLNQPGIG